MPWPTKAIILWAEETLSETQRDWTEQSYHPNLQNNHQQTERLSCQEITRPQTRVKQLALQDIMTGQPKKTKGRGAQKGKVQEGLIEQARTSELGLGPAQSLREEDNDATPRANTIDGKKRRWAEELSEAGSPAKRPTLSASYDSNTSRSVSPTNRNVLLSLPQPIECKTLDAAELSEQDMELLQELRRCAAGFETVPQSLLPSLMAKFPNDMNLLQNVSYEPGSYRSQLGADPSLHNVLSITAEARGCYERSETDATWNTHVHGPLLVLARALSIHRARIGTTNVTTAKINPEYKPAPGTDQQPLQGKAVDFVLFLEPSHKTSDAFHHLPWESATYGRDLNHTLHEPIADRPIAVSIETKREDEGQITAQVQLCVWVASHFNRLQQLLNSAESEENKDNRLPALPLLLAQGPVLSFLLARRHYKKATQGGRVATTVYSKLIIGDATNASGVCKIISGLMKVFDWMEKRYRPWFEEVCSQITSGEK